MSDPYRLLPLSLPQDSVQLHVLARAYRAAWISLHAEAPRGVHRLDRLGVAIAFEEPDRPRPG